MSCQRWNRLRISSRGRRLWSACATDEGSAERVSNEDGNERSSKRGRQEARTHIDGPLPRSAEGDDVYQTDSHFVGVWIDHVRLQEVQHARHRTLLLREGDAVAAEDAAFLLLPRRTILMNPQRLRGGGGGGGGGGGRRHEVVRCQGEHGEGCLGREFHCARSEEESKNTGGWEGEEM